MPYTPEALSENDRRWQYSMIWVGGMASPISASPLTSPSVVFSLLSCVFFLALMAKRARGSAR